VRVQRVQEISEEDAKADGIEPFGPDDGRWVFAYTFKLLSNPGRPDAGLPRGS
jgi:hypothetical protein